MARRPPPQQPQRPNLSIEEKRRGIARLEGRIQELEAFDPQKVQKRFSDPNLMALEIAIDEALSAIFGHGTVEYSRYDRAKALDHGPVTMRVEPMWSGSGGGVHDDAHEARQYVAEGKQEALTLLRQAVRSLNEEIDDEVAAEQAARAVAAPEAPAVPRDQSKVFLVHGHDGEVRETVARFISEKLGLEPVILHERPNKGRTIITKFREESAGVGFAVVLMTPDDVGKAAEAAVLKPRARQNVVFELGFFIGALGAENVAAIVKGDVERPSDFDGVVYISYEKEDWRTKLGQELQSAGYQIDWNKVMAR
ncbi:MAG: TIR domain-containing protein [Alphaproteobacteria bacterium]